MQHNDYVGFFENAARKHIEIANDQPVPGNGRRQSFFRINEEDEIQQSLMDGAAFPALCLQMYQGKLNAADKGLVRDWVYGGFDIRDHVADIRDYAAIEEARDRCKRIGDEVLALMLRESEDPCSIFKALDVNSIRYRFFGPVNTCEFGCSFNFNWKTNAGTVNNTDIDTVFSL